MEPSAAIVEQVHLGPRDIAFLVAMILGGLVLFIHGMSMMSDGLRKAAASKMRTYLSHATHNRFVGLLFGGALSTLIQSSATSVMLVGFINAGLMTLVEAIPPVLGMNVGTTISMQLVAFKLGDYCFFLMTIGFLLYFAGPNDTIRNIGQVLLGFGIIFLGLNTMSGAIRPHRAMFAELLKHIHGHTLGGIFTGLALSTAITAIIQSSGAVIGMCFALANSGVFTEIQQAFPIVLGAHIGTCATGLLGSIGTNIEARRAAVSHLVFNIINSTLCGLIAPVFYWLIPLTSTHLDRQIANAHMFVMIFGAALFLPFTKPYVQLIRKLTPSKQPLPTPSFLDQRLVKFPEKAIYAAISELQRVMKVCKESFNLSIDVLFRPERSKVRVIKRNEEVVDEIKRTMKDFLAVLSRRYLSRRQSILVQHLNRCMADVERIGDHIDEICDISIRRWKIKEARFDRAALEQLCTLHAAVGRVLRLVIDSLNPENPDFQAVAQAILRARDEYVEKSMEIKAAFAEKLAEHQYSPIVGIFFSEYVAAFDRIVKHAKVIALAEKQPYFWIKRKKLDRMVEEEPGPPPPPLADPHDFLDRLHAEDYL